MDDKRLLINRIEDKRFEYERNECITTSFFLSINEQSDISGILKKDKEAFLFGGFLDAERKEVHFIPKYLEISSEEEILSYYILNEDICNLCVLEITIPKNEGRELSHRDYLGAILSLGINRDKIGDILVKEKGADVIIEKDIADFLLKELTYIGRISISKRIKGLRELDLSKISFEEIKISIPSLRLDNYISEVYKVSRSSAKEYIEKGVVFVNGIEINKSDFHLKKDDKVVLRGKGKSIFIEESGVSRKGNIYLLIKKYV